MGKRDPVRGIQEDCKERDLVRGIQEDWGKRDLVIERETGGLWEKRSSERDTG